MPLRARCPWRSTRWGRFQPRCSRSSSPSTTERDTPTALADYVKTFDPRIVALTGSAEQIAAAAKAYRVSYTKVTTGNAGSYLMDHSSIVYLMDTEGRLATFFPPDTTSERIVDALRRLLPGS
jgi:protein SCO1/2